MRDLLAIFINTHITYTQTHIFGKLLRSLPFTLFSLSQFYYVDRFCFFKRSFVSHNFCCWQNIFYLLHVTSWLVIATYTIYSFSVLSTAKLTAIRTQQKNICQTVAQALLTTNNKFHSIIFWFLFILFYIFYLDFKTGGFGPLQNTEEILDFLEKKTNFYSI